MYVSFHSEWIIYLLSEALVAVHSRPHLPPPLSEQLVYPVGLNSGPLELTHLSHSTHHILNGDDVATLVQHTSDRRLVPTTQRLEMHNTS